MSFRLLIVILLVSQCVINVTGNYPCLCCYLLELDVYSDPNPASKIVGLMFEYDCKPTFPVTASSNPDFITVQFQNKIGYVRNIPGSISIESCPGTASLVDIVTTGLPLTHFTTPTKQPTVSPTTIKMTTSSPTTSKMTTSTPTTSKMTTSSPTTSKMTTSSPTTSKMTTSSPTTSKITTSSATTIKMTTSSPTTSKMTTSSPTTSVATTAGPTTSTITTSMPTTSKMITSMPTTTSRPSTTTPKPTTSSPTTASIITTSRPGTQSTTITTTSRQTTHRHQNHHHQTTTSVHTTHHTSHHDKPHCPPLWKHIIGDSCYRVNLNHMMNYTAAQNFCQNHTSHLVYIESKQEFQALKEYIQTLSRYKQFLAHNQTNAGVWIGAEFKHKEWRWGHGSGHVDMNYTNWVSNDHITGNCAAMHLVPDFHWYGYNHCHSGNTEFETICEQPVIQPAGFSLINPPQLIG